MPYYPLGENIPTSMALYNINDSVLTEEEVEWAVRRLLGQRLRGLSQIVPSTSRSGYESIGCRNQQQKLRMRE